MTQLNLFQTERPVPEPRPSNPAFIRKHLIYELNKAREAIRVPWAAAEAQAWVTRFPKLAEVLPADEAEELTTAFAAELARLGI